MEASTSERAGELPKQYNHGQAQARWYPFWVERGYFHEDAPAQAVASKAQGAGEKRDARGRAPYSIVIPPPNVTGALHLGHALNNSLQDILARWKRMQGFNVLWMPGTDHAGIATQAVVERRLFEEEKKTRHDLGRAKLVERIWAWKNEYETRILGQLQQMGCSCDWQRTRFTLDEVCARAVRETFFKMFRDGLIYRGQRLVNWDSFLQTAVSDDEVFHETVAGHFWHFRYRVIDPKSGEPDHVVIATTRPETMLGDTAVAVHPNPAAALDRAEAELKTKLAASAEKDAAAVQAALDDIATRRREVLPQLVKFAAMARAGRRLMLPLLNREIPLVADEWAKPELGSGCVKITPAHDVNDYEVGRRQNLPMINILNPDGTLNAQAGKYQGLKIPAARERVVADLESLGLVEAIEDREIELAHSDRSKTPIEPYLADQWFIRMQDLAQSAMDAVSDGRVKIIPSRYAKGYLDWLGEKRDWPVSRQLWWGHQIPVWHKTGKASVKESDELAKKLPGWIAAERAAIVGSLADENCLVCVRGEDDAEVVAALEAGGAFARDSDVLDTWFSSALWPHSTLGWPEQTDDLAYYYPTSTLVTSRDIITLWVARMVLTGLYNMGEIPFRDVFIHPKILDGFGEGMSKSKGNGVDPLDVIEKFGADALRFALCHMTTETQDVRMPVEFECPHCHALIEQTKKNRVQPRVDCKQCGQPFATQWASKPADTALPRGAVTSERFEQARNFCNKLWNASRFVLMNLDGYTPGRVAEEQLAIEDRWLLSRLTTVTREVTAALEGYHFADAARVLYDFAWNEFCSFYVEMVKSRLADEAARPTAQRVLAHTLDVLLRLLHPMVPFVTEEVWQLLGARAAERGIDQPAPAAESIMIAPWPEADGARHDSRIESQFAIFQQVLGGLREIRSRQNIPKAEMRFAVDCQENEAALLRPMETYFATMANARATDWGPKPTLPAASTSFRFTGGEVHVDMTGLVDVGAEIARKEKELAEKTKAIASKEKQLANANFVSRAPAEVVEKERAALAVLKEQVESLQAELAAL
ncbi:MAG TPA: valine--tRNA ligase, partial [Pirellulales bacterium]|nr:valine--tRNA ligase [Pirellulales bacterium]